MSEHDRALLEEINDRLKRLEDIEALRALIVDYACACDRGNDPEMLAPLFAEDGTWECQGFGKYVGREQVAKGLHGIAGEKIWWSLHYMISPRIELGADGDTATAFWYLWEATPYPTSTAASRRRTGSAPPTRPAWSGARAAGSSPPWS